jgi:hypothetical protein
MSDVQQPPANTTVRLEPITENIIVPQPWYRRIFGTVFRTETKWRLTVLTVLVIGVYIGWAIKTPQRTVTQANVGKAHVSIFPIKTEIPPEKSFQLWVKTDQVVTSADIVITFDPKVIQISREIIPMVIPNGDMTYTPVEQANTTGLLRFHLTAKTATVPIQPVSIQLGTIYFNPVKGTMSETAIITVHQDETIFMNQNAIPFEISSTNSTVSIK